MELAQPLLVESIPDVDVPVRAARRERVVHRVEADRVHGVDLL